MSEREKTSVCDRLSPCECCGHPLSQRHHLLDVAAYGENIHTCLLCANCHDLYHLVERARRGDAQSSYLLRALTFKTGVLDDVMKWLNVKLDEAERLKGVRP